MFTVLRDLDAPVEITRNGRVEGVLCQPSAARPEIDRRRLARVCERYGVRRLLAFGSYARGEDFGPASDVDVLVDLLPGVKKTFARFSDLTDALADVFGRPVDLLDAKILNNPEIAETIGEDVRKLYEAH